MSMGNPANLTTRGVFFVHFILADSKCFNEDQRNRGPKGLQVSGPNRLGQNFQNFLAVSES